MPFEWLTALDVRDVTGDGPQGGYMAALSFWNSQGDVPMFREIDLYHRNFSGTSWEGADRVAMKGYLDPSTIVANRATSTVSANAYTFHRALSDIPVTGCYFIDSAAGAHAHQINNLSLALVIEHLASHHVTITGGIDTTQVDTTGSTQVTPYIVRENASLWRAMQRIAQDEFYVIYFDRENRLVYKPHPQFDAVLPDVVAVLDSDNLLQPYRVDYRTGRKARNVVVLGLTNAAQVLESTYPSGAAVDVRGPRYEVRCNTQARLDVLAERQYKWLNRDYTATVLLANAWNIELFDRVQLTLSGTATNGVNFSWTNKDFWVQRVTYRKSFTFGYTTELVLEEGYT